jgi:iron complex transport system substrate-binding protein
VLHLLHKFMPLAATRFIALSLICLPQLSAQTVAPATSPVPLTREVVDEAGRTVRVPLSPLRIVSLAPSLTETIYALGLQDRLVGDTDFCDYPSDAQKKPKVGGGINPNLEEIASLHPDLVLVTNSFNRLETVRALDSLGIPSYDIDPHTVDEIVASTEKLAGVLGVPEAGKTLADDLQRRLSALQTKLAALPQTKVLFVVWTEPLMSIGKGTFVADALRKAGASSIVESSRDWPQMNLEEVVHLQPDFLIFPETHSDAGAHDFDTLALKPGWRLLDAVHNRRFAVVSDAVIRPAPRIVSVIEDLARQLHPDAFLGAPGTMKETVPQNRMNPTHNAFYSQPDALSNDSSFTVVACAR